MIVLEATITMPSWIKKRTWNVIMKAAFHDLALFWHANILKKHFKPAAAAEYNYKPRAPLRDRKGRIRRKKSGAPLMYDDLKQRLKGHRNPLVWSGEMKGLLLRRSSAHVSSTSRGFRLKLFGGGHANYTQRHREIVAVSARDRKAMQKHLLHYIQRKLRRWTGMVRIAA